MATILLAETDPKLKKTIHEVENMCHAAELGIIIHHEGEDLDELLDSVDSKIIVFTPKGNLSLDQMVGKYGDNALLIIGGFTEKRDFREDVSSRADDTVSLCSEFLTIPRVIEKIIDAYERKAKLR
jgi:rRNA pseudouridine-1189 N-methylase Emg1 (Nep1/Mra1 family)